MPSLEALQRLASDVLHKLSAVRTCAYMGPHGYIHFARGDDEETIMLKLKEGFA